MAVIEHKTMEGVIGAYESSGLTKFAIYQGTEPIMVYDGDDPQEAGDKLETWLNFIHEGGTAAIYKLRVYKDTCKEITNKTGYHAVTRFQLNSSKTDSYEQTPDGRVMVIRDGGRKPNMSGTNAQMQAILDGQTKMLDLVAKMLEKKEGDRMDKLIGFLEEKSRKPDPDPPIDKLMKLGELIVDKPDIIDRIGYIFRPNIYQRVEQEPQQTAVNGTKKKDEPTPVADPPEKENTMEEVKELTEEEVTALNDRLDAAMDIIEEHVGLSALVEIMEALSTQKPEKLQKLDADKLNSAFKFL